MNILSQKTIKEVEDNLTTFLNMQKLCRMAISEGCVLLKNDNFVLPINNKKISIFGRCQIDTFYVGYGSGGDVKPPYKVSILEGLKNNGALINESLVEIYEEYSKNNVPKDGKWGHWPMSYSELDVKEEIIIEASKNSDVALVVIGRAAGEDRENTIKEGSWYLTKTETRLLQNIRKHFKEMVVLINAGSIMDMSIINSINPNSIIYCYHGGQETGNGVADVLLGKTSPSGRLTTTIARIEDYPSFKNFGGKYYNNYSEDIYVGYRYFNTFAKDKILYPFGYGLSYTDFVQEKESVEVIDETTLKVNIKVKNIGNYPSKEVVQVYMSAPNGRLGKPKEELVAFSKTKVLNPSEECLISVNIDLKDFASFDDKNSNSYILEKGEYKIFLKSNCTENIDIISIYLNEDKYVLNCFEACAPNKKFKRMVNKNNQISYEDVPLSKVDLKERILTSLPEESKTNSSYSLKQVKRNEISLDEFVACLSDTELEAITRGSLQGMNSSYGPKGNAGTLGGCLNSMFTKDIIPLSTNDGPSGVRLQAHSTLLPNGVCLASTFNTELIEELTYELGKEVKERGSHILLAPGMNIHRNPLCGRNFEYFSEDPYLTGKIAASYVKGVQNAKVSATPKHFACNNQEYKRWINDSRVSARALKEIYLKAFKIVIKEAKPDVIMTSYNKINGTFSYYNYDLATTILRNEFGFEGLIITDWWMRNRRSPLFKGVKNQAYRIRAGVDVFMPGSANIGIYKGKSDGSILKSLKHKEGITRAELQKCAKNVLKLCLKYLDE